MHGCVALDLRKCLSDEGLIANDTACQKCLKNEKHPAVTSSLAPVLQVESQYEEMMKLHVPLSLKFVCRRQIKQQTNQKGAKMKL